MLEAELSSWRQETMVVEACIGIDVGGTNLRFALVDRNGRVLHREKWRTNISRGSDHFLGSLSEGIALMREAAEGRADIVAVGMGIPGLIGRSGTILSSVNLVPLEGLNLQELVGTASGLPTISLNDANAAAYGEKRFGAGKHFDSLLLLTLGTGVGSGLVLDGALWTGADGIAAEYGHATVEPDGIPCPCGNRGCLEQYASATAIVRAAEEAVRSGCTGELAACYPEGITAETIAIAAGNNDPVAVSLYENAGRYLGIAAATIANLLNIEAVLLGGGVAGSFDLLVGTMRAEMLRRCFPVPGARLKILPGELGDDAGILGAAVLAGEAALPARFTASGNP